MNKQLTISIDEKIYDRLHCMMDENSVSQFIEDLLRPYVIKQDLEFAYQKMAKDEERENSALEWSESIIGDVADETW